jgi:hypothetical protein
VFVVVINELAQDLLEMAPTEDEEPIEALTADGAYEALGERIGTRRLNGRLDDSDAFGAEHLVETGGELRVSVPDEELHWSGALEKIEDEVARLLSDQLPAGFAVMLAT